MRPNGLVTSVISVFMFVDVVVLSGKVVIIVLLGFPVVSMYYINISSSGYWW